MARYIDERNTQSSPQGFNAETEKIANTQQDHLSRKSTSGPNQMETTLDMNSERIINLPAPQSDNEPLRQADLDLAQSQVEQYVDSGVQQIDSAIDAAQSTLDSKVQKATSQANRAESEANRAEVAASNAASEAANQLESTFTGLKNQAEAASSQSLTYRNEAFGFRNETEEFKTSARDSALQLQEFIDQQGVELVFPLDLGFITDAIISASYDLGRIA